MRRKTNNQRFVEIIIGIMLIMFGLSLLFDGSAAPFGWFILTAGGMMLYRHLNRTNTELNSQRSQTWQWSREEREPHLVTDAPSGTQIYAHALEAVRSAGIDPAESPVLPVDLGVMAFTSDRPPSLHRTRPILDNVDYIQPFVQLRLTTRAAGKIRFEIVDSDGQILFVHEEFHDLKPGMNLISPPSRLPIHDAQAMHGDWSLRVSADGIVLAEHHFQWMESTEKVIRRHVQVDGELSGEMRQMLEDNRLERMSLDDLLSEQEEEVPRQQARH
ncbi:MAG: hypothetical protein KC547_04700 [Anaerolineae bacterium]|nr:hypothetical protein [Anaerolineae bacterium]MCA9910321.1 hypothetical protein [Anaerolineae bacterium]